MIDEIEPPENEMEEMLVEASRRLFDRGFTYDQVNGIVDDFLDQRERGSPLSLDDCFDLLEVMRDARPEKRITH